MRDGIFDQLRAEDRYFVNLDEECLKKMTFRPDGIWAMKSLSAVRAKLKG
jgi:hypothetical protein